MTIGTQATRAATIEAAIEAWVETYRIEQHPRTAAHYGGLMQCFREMLVSQGLDLDSADPRLLHAGGQSTDYTDPNVRGAVEDSVNYGQQTKEQGEQGEQTKKIGLWALGQERAAQIATVLQLFARTRVGALRHLGETAASTQAQRMSVIATFYNFAFAYGYLRGSNPLDQIIRPPYRPESHLCLTWPTPVAERLIQIGRLTDIGLRDYALLLIRYATKRTCADLWEMRLGHLTMYEDVLQVAWPYSHEADEEEASEDFNAHGVRKVIDRLPLTGPDAQPAQALLRWASRVSALRHAEQRRTVAGAASWEACPEREQPIWVSLARAWTRGRRLAQGTIAVLCKQRLGATQSQLYRHQSAPQLGVANDHTEAEILLQLGAGLVNGLIKAPSRPTTPSETPAATATGEDRTTQQLC
jgi:hypothetical protein